MSLHQVKDHQIAQLVNTLRGIAREYAETQQLRERISREVNDFLALTKVNEEPEEQPTHCPSCKAPLQYVECSHCGYDTSQKCEVPPQGWKCSRAKGHEGPCAASPEVIEELTSDQLDAIRKASGLDQSSCINVPEFGQERCEYCDGSRDVHRADGEWLGECTACNASAELQLRKDFERNWEQLYPDHPDGSKQFNTDKNGMYLDEYVRVGWQLYKLGKEDFK